MQYEFPCRKSPKKKTGSIKISQHKLEELEDIKEKWNDENLIQIQSLYKIYKDKYVETIALRSFSLTIKKGELIAIMGPSGSGKTTLVNIIAGLLKPTTGSVYFKGPNKNVIDLSLLSRDDLVNYRRDYIGLVFQDFQLFENLNVIDNVEIPLLIYQDENQDSKDEVRDPNNQESTEPHNIEEIIRLQGFRYNKIKAQTLTDFVGLEKRKYQLVAKLSGGEKQRVAICAALIKNPPLIITDEPTGELDSDNANKIFNLLRDICKKIGTTIVIVSHDPLVKNYVDRVISISDGTVQKIQLAGDI